MRSRDETHDRDRDAGETSARAGRPRDPRLDEAVVAATLQLLAEEGYAQLTVERIAARAGVGKASLYRRWPDKVSIVLEAVSRNPERPSAPDTGSLRGDALTYLRTLVRYRTLHFDAISAISGEALSDERFGDAFRAGMTEPIIAGMRDDPRASRRARRTPRRDRRRPPQLGPSGAAAGAAPGRRTPPGRRLRGADRRPVLLAGRRDLRTDSVDPDESELP